MKTNPYGAVFEGFRPWSGVVPAGLRAGFLGNVSVIDRLYPGKYIESLRDEAKEARFVRTARPLPRHTDYFEMGAVLSSVAAAQQQFSMMELGAGTGPWTAAAACATLQTGVKERFFVAVEAEPTRFQWLGENLAINGIRQNERSIYQGVVFPSSKRDHRILFPVGAPMDAGQFACIDEPLNSRIGQKRRVNLYGLEEEAHLEPARVITLGDLLSWHQDTIFDIVHIDIQGAEAEVIDDARHKLDAQVRAVAIGTHGEKIERSLRDILMGLGWVCIFDFPRNGSFTVDGDEISTRDLDGFQHWMNPRLRLSNAQDGE